MIVRIHAGQSVAVDIEATPTWTATASGRFGSCQFNILRDSAVWNDDVFAQGGGYLVEVFTRFGIWRGVTDSDPNYTPWGVQVTAESLHAWTSIRHMSQPRLYQSCPAGIVARDAFRQAIIGHDGMPLTLGKFVICPPLVDIELIDQPLSAVLAELTDLTGQEWYINDDLQVNWVMREGTFRQVAITDDGRLFPDIKIEAGQAGEVIEIDDSGRRFVAVSGEASRLWPSQESERI